MEIKFKDEQFQRLKGKIQVLFTIKICCSIVVVVDGVMFLCSFWWLVCFCLIVAENELKQQTKQHEQVQRN
jgi:hypothetical protein